MARTAALVALLSIVVSAGCVGTTSNICGDGSICPGGFVCDTDNARCLLPEQIAACAGIADGETCTLPSEPGAPAACRVGACIAFFCGDGYVTSGEDCEPTQTADQLGADCKDFGAYAADGLKCSPSCVFDAGSKEQRTGCFASEFCGDREVNGPELCDGPENRTCVSIGYDAGTAACTLDCGFTIGDCSRFGWNPESLGDQVALAVAGSRIDDQWSFGLNGRAMHFQGAFWNQVPTGTTQDLTAGWSFSAEDTWAIAQSRNNGATPARVLRWDGTQWSDVAGIPAGEYVDVWGPAVGEVFVATTTGILVLSNGAWSSLAGVDGQPDRIRGSSKDDVWVVTKQGPLKHHDGTQWTDRTPPGTVIQFLDVNAPDDVWGIGFSAANEGTAIIAHWSGTSWQQWVRPQEHYNAIASSAPNDTWVAGLDGIMRHWDGIAWSHTANIGASPSGLTALAGLLSLGPDAVVGVSTLNLAYRYRGQAFGAFPSLGPDPFTAPVNVAVWGTTAAEMFVGNVKGEVWHFDGTAWTLSFAIPSAAGLTDLVGNASDDVWASFNDGAVAHYDGQQWTTSMITNLSPRKMWTHPSGEVWAFTDGGALRKNGASWDIVAFGQGTPHSVSGSSVDNLWVVQGSPARLWNFDGTNWTEVATGASAALLAVVAIATDDVHVAAADGRFEHWNGTAWTEQVIPVLADITMLAATADDDVVAASQRDLAHYDGRSWSTMRTPVDFVPNTSDYLPLVDLQVSPGRIDMLQERFRVRTLIRTRPLVCRTREICGDGVDNDCNHRIDAVDDECK